MTKQRVPNLFLIGAPKCGTTAMSHYLAGHPDIYMSESSGVKEPSLFARDLSGSHSSLEKRINDWESYLQLFNRAPRTTKFLGEASVYYLFSRCAVPRIMQTCPDARLVVMLRNPVDLVASYHNQRIRNGVEVPSLENAWNLQEKRKQGRQLPPTFTDGALLQYADIAKLGTQVERLLHHADKQQVHFIVYDDFTKDPCAAYKGLLDFLELPDDGRSDFQQINASMSFRWSGLEAALQTTRRLRARLGLPGGLGIHAAINRINGVHRRPALRPEFRGQLYDFFRDDVSLLSRLIDRDLSTWQQDQP